MKIDVQEGDTFWQCDTTMWQIRGEKFRWIGNGNEWSSTQDGRYPICGSPRRLTTTEAARKNAESLGHELVMPEERGPWFTLSTNTGQIIAYATKAQRDAMCCGACYKPCDHTGKVESQGGAR